MQILDYLQVENIAAARDAAALLAGTIEQAVMDNGRMDFASVLCLQDDLPPNIFVNRNAGAMSHQKWITVALAYLKELDTIQAKQAEFAGAAPKAPSRIPSNATPKPEGAPKKKGKGKGAQARQDSQNGEELEEPWALMPLPFPGLMPSDRL